MAIIYREESGKKGRLFLTILITILFGGFFGLQFWAAYRVQIEASKELQKLEKLTVQDLSDQKIKEEAFSLAIKNVQARVFESTLIGNLSAGIGVTVTLAGFIFGLLQYFDIRKKEYSQTISNIFSKLWEDIADDNPKIQARAIIGLADFLSEDNKAYHEGTMSALALLGKIYNLELLETKEEDKNNNNNNSENNSENNEISEKKKDSSSVVTIAEGALRRVLEIALEFHPATFRSTSWQGIKCFRFRADIPSNTEIKGKLDLTQADFRDSTLIEANFSKLNLHQARFNASCLIGAKFVDTDLTKAEMQYADLTGANLQKANLKGANLLNAKILNTDLKGAKLKGAKISRYSTDWRLAKNWREADFDDDVKKDFLEKYGPLADKNFKILMLLWEYPSYVTGGGWTAAYHFIQQMRRKGANITVLVPWPPEFISPYAFGNEIEVYPVGNPTTQRSLAAFSGYTSAYSSVYIEESEGESQYYASSRFELINDFTNRALQEVYEKKIDFNVIHADDWLTFPAAQRISEWANKPWIAHFHSTEYERRPEPVNLGVSRIERQFSNYASRILVPGSSTRRIVTEKYGAEDSKIFVLPNCLSRSETEEAGLGSEALGEFHTQTVIFSGRLQWQKGIDIFLDIAQGLSFIRPGTKFCVHGRGEHDYVEEAKNTSVYQTVYFSNTPLDFERTVYGKVELSDTPIDSESLEKDIYIWKLAPVTITDDNEYQIIRSISSKEEKDVLWHEIRERGFTIDNADNAISLHYPFLLRTHDKGDEFHRDYLIRISGLKDATYSYSPTEDIPFKGFTRWEKRSSVFEGASVCVVPSRFEPFGMIVLEAMCHGVPVVYPKHSGVAEVINAGLAVDFSKEGEVIEAISDLLDDMNRWEEIVQQQAQEIKRYYECSYADDLNKHLREVVRGCGNDF